MAATSCSRARRPRASFEAKAAGDGPDYARSDAWLARPEVEETRDLTEWRPEGAPAREHGSRRAAVFYIHPTTYLDRDRWNAPLRPDGPFTEDRTRLFLRSQASAFEDSRRNLGAALPPGGVWRLPARFGGRQTSARSGLWRCPRGIRRLCRRDPGRSADHPRRAQPGLAPFAAPARRAPRCAEGAAGRGLCRRLAGQQRPPICPAPAWPPAQRRTAPPA